MLSYETRTTAEPTTVWRLIAEPDRWRAWAPHVRGAWGLGSPEVREGARGAARLGGIVPVPARVTAKEPGRSWDWRVGPVRLRHRVAPLTDGALVGIDISAPPGLERLLAVTYGPAVSLLLRNLARVAERA